MRRVEVSVPKGQIDDVARLAFACGISEISVVDKLVRRPGSETQTRHFIDMSVPTPAAKAFVGELSRAPFYDREKYHVSIREPRANLTAESQREMTKPLAAPIADIDQELWQFSHVTSSFVARIFIAALLLAYGMIDEHWLFMAAGLIFLPFMPLILAMSYGGLRSEPRLVAQAALALVVATILIAGASALVAVAAEPPMEFDKFPPMIAGIIFSATVGIAGALATADDAGHRQLVGLAAASQVALLPAWFGISLVYGFSDSVSDKAISFGANIVALMLGALVVYALLGGRKQAPHKR
jgi:hypothetical protein